MSLTVAMSALAGCTSPLERYCDAHAELAATTSPVRSRGIDAYKMALLNAGDGLPETDAGLLSAIEELSPKGQARCQALREWIVRLSDEG